ncbi:MAG: hypothetical protein OXH13_04915 [Chloroflexi bacterium]|nr:hypothetical protein [Chloroflexota bacterium]MCY3696153.1 hypothetical protein [Chloroflexota bacterium]
MSDPETRIKYAQSILERHESAASEADIRSAVRDFLIRTGLAPESEIQQEEAPAPGETGRVDLRTRDVIIEFKRSIGTGITPHHDYVTTLDEPGLSLRLVTVLLDGLNEGDALSV